MGTGLFTICSKSCWPLSPEFLHCGATCYKCTCNLGLCFTLWDTETREIVLPCWYSCLSAVLWGTSCLALITVSLSTSGNYRVMTNQPACVLSHLLWNLVTFCHLLWGWSSSLTMGFFFPAIILLWFWALTNTISPPKMSPPRASCTCGSQGSAPGRASCLL